MAGPSTFPRTQRIGIFVYDRFEPIDVWGFLEAFSIARFLGTGYSSPPPYPFEIVLIGRTMANVKSINGPSVAPDWDFDRARQEPLDLLMVPGGGGTWPLLDDRADPTGVAALLEWMRVMDSKVRIMASVCTGAAVLAKCGFLDGLPATTNHGAFGWVASHGPRALWDNVSRWVDAGKYVTSAGVSAGTDLGFHLVSRMAGRAVAENAVSAAEYDWHRDPQTPIFYPQQAAV
ncbi:MAG: DJ-1/PfpI family protein [Bradyrhizobium sp.]|uniref:DJ-1/PfpI family protein n=1 Tax=Bradyrhizobium sp. TaxID=376 RepID=UPI00271770A1|nr:DJ-1/PfpI family protein [Bradyrhizobium sp.]MDO8398892.1 DJ-1/PfpI family protein [Bradyrhizobium sp.]MDO9059543.1 DJ-1/PfpI family protein [Bradyrhizobium sp.]